MPAGRQEGELCFVHKIHGREFYGQKETSQCVPALPVPGRPRAETDTSLKKLPPSSYPGARQFIDTALSRERAIFPHLSSSRPNQER